MPRFSKEPTSRPPLRNMFGEAVRGCAGRPHIRPGRLPGLVACDEVDTRLYSIEAQLGLADRPPYFRLGQVALHIQRIKVWWGLTASTRWR